MLSFLSFSGPLSFLLGVVTSIECIIQGAHHIVDGKIVLVVLKIYFIFDTITIKDQYLKINKKKHIKFKQRLKVARNK